MMPPSSITIDIVESGLDFIISHFQPPFFPRTVSTKNTAGRQILVYSKEEILSRFRNSDFIDCRINSYSDVSGQIPPSLLFIDIDKSNFKTRSGLIRALNGTLANMKTRLSVHPTVLWTGGGYHIYQPINAIPLEHISNFNGIDQPSTKFLRWAAKFLSNSKSDPNNFQSVKSCMSRIPGSINSKHSLDNQVKIIQSWDGCRPNINLLLGSFYSWTIGNKIKNDKNQIRSSTLCCGPDPCEIRWVERLLKLPIADGRKNVVSLILAPYLINIKKVTTELASVLIMTWLEKCDRVRKLDSNFKYLVKYALKRSQNTGYKPLRLDNLKLRNKPLYDLVIRASTV